MDIDPYWIVGGGVGIALLGVVAWFYTQRDPDPGEDDAASDQVRQERSPEPPEVAVEAAADPLTDTAVDSAVEAPAQTDAGTERKPPEPGAAALEVPTESENEAPLAPPEERAEQDEAPREPPEEPAQRDEAFEAARARLERELRAGHFSRLDIFDAWERADWKPGQRKPPRSEYFHRVANEAVSVRNAFEKLLCEEDRARFVDAHSRYLDDVTELEDPGDRERAHEEQLRFLAELRPRAAGATAADGD